MNEQIKQLEKDALYFALQFRAGLNGDLTDYETEIIFREKFAEMIVKECIGVVEGGRFLHDQAPTALFAKECSGAIREHFGVEE